MMDTTLALLTGLLGTAFITVLFFAALAGAWLLGRHSQRRGSGAEASAATDEGVQKMAEMTSRIDELTLELERTAEGHRYLAKMLTVDPHVEMQKASDPMRVPGRVVTPH